MIPDDLNETLVWRAIAWRRHYGHWELLFEDTLICTRAGDYLLEAQALKAEKITFHLLGPYKNVKDMNMIPLRGAEKIANLNKLKPLEEFA